MESLSNVERELVAIGAALGSNCAPCTEYHIQEARKAGLSDRQIGEAAHLADMIRQVPARKALETALGMLPKADAASLAKPDGADSAQRLPDSRAAQRCCS